MLRPIQRMPADLGSRLAEEASAHPAARPGAVFERWYLKRWHCLPEGYLSPRSVSLYHHVIRRLYSCGLERQVASHIAAACRAMGARDVLEIGFGSGSLLARLRDAEPGLVLSGADLSPYCVEHASDRMGPAPISLVHADARDLPWANASFDAVIASHVLGHIPAGVAAGILTSARRLLREGGQLFTVEHAWHEIPSGGFSAAGEARFARGLVRLRTMV